MSSRAVPGPTAVAAAGADAGAARGGAARTPRAAPAHPGAVDLAAKTIPLRADWDRQPKLGDGRGHHVARAGVDGALADFVERRAEGALLVVGHRGSGKTSSVVAAANRAAGRERHGKTVVPIMITATSMDKTVEDGRKTLLRSLIWALRLKAGEIKGINKTILRRTEELYRDATASVKSYELSQNETRSMALGAHLAHAAAAGSALAVLSLHGMIELGLTVAPAAALASFAAKRAWDWKASRSATRLYRRDYGFADMQHDFEGLLREYACRHSIVFILDEFDKDDDFADMIRPLKMLLNQGDAAYVVITAPDKAKTLLESRGVDSTLFSEVLYINRPSFREMGRFIDDVVGAEGKEAISAVDYDDFRCCMRYKSQTGFFNLYGALRDRRTGVGAEGRPLINASLDEQEKTEANLQRAIEYVYDRKAYGAQSMQMANDGMLDAMYEAAARAEGLHGRTITVNDKQVAFDEKPAEYSPNAESAVRDLLFLLYKQGYLAKTLEGPYRIAGKLAGFDPAGMFVAEENAFMEAYDAARDALANFANVRSALVDGHGEAFSGGQLDSRLDEMIRVAGSIVSITVSDEARVYRTQMRQPRRPLIDPDKLREHTDSAKAMLDTLRTNTVDLLSQVLERKGFPLTLYDQLLPTLVAVDFAKGQNIRNAVHQWGGDGEDGEISISIIPVQDASFISKVRNRVSPLSYHLREIHIALVGDVEPVGLEDSAIRVGHIRGAGNDGAGAGAFEMAKKHSTYILAVASPLDAKTAEAVVSIVKLVVARLESSKKESFDKFWSALFRAAGAAGGGHSPHRPRPPQGGGGSGRQGEATARQPGRRPQGGAPP